MAILLVDDSDIILEAEKEMLESCGLTVDTATDGRQATELAAHASYEMILLDMQISETDGYTVARELRQKGITTPILAMFSAVADDREALEAAGINGVLVKPLELHTVQETVNAYIQLPASVAVRWKRKSDVLFDYDALCDAVGDHNAALHLIGSFLSTHKKDGKTILEAIARKDYATAESLLHDVVSISGVLGCHRLYHSAYKLGINVKSKPSEGVEFFRSAWLDSVVRLSDIYDRHISEIRQQPVQGCTDWPGLVSDFIDLAKDFDTMATELFGTYRSEFQAHLPPELFGKLWESVIHFDYLEIQQLMEGYHV